MDSSDILSSPARLEALRRTALMDSPAEEAFDRLTRLAARMLGTRVAICTLFDAERHFFKSIWGLPEQYTRKRERPMALSFCQLAVVQGAPLVIQDARQDARLKDHPGIQDFKIVSYLGIPLVTSEGHALGTFCVFDQQPRVWSEEDLQAAKDLAASVVTEIELRTLAREAQRRAAEAQAAQAQAEALAARNAQLYREAQEGSRLRERMVSVVSHDLKTPLQTVLLAARQLERLAERVGMQELEPVRKGATRIGAAATRMSALERVLSNLISNAVKYSPAGDRVFVRLREEQGLQGRWALLEVEDHGLGIPTEDLPHIFSWFQRGRNVRERIDGTGIGLASAKNVVERHGGTLTVSSQEGVGSTFTVRLPLAPV